MAQVKSRKASVRDLSFECVDEFDYLGNKISAEGGADDSSEASKEWLEEV